MKEDLFRFAVQRAPQSATTTATPPARIYRPRRDPSPFRDRLLRAQSKVGRRRIADEFLDEDAVSSLAALPVWIGKLRDWTRRHLITGATLRNEAERLTGEHVEDLVATRDYLAARRNIADTILATAYSSKPETTAWQDMLGDIIRLFTCLETLATDANAYATTDSLQRALRSLLLLPNVADAPPARQEPRDAPNKNDQRKKNRDELHTLTAAIDELVAAHEQRSATIRAITRDAQRVESNDAAVAKGKRQKNRGSGIEKGTKRQGALYSVMLSKADANRLSAPTRNLLSASRLPLQDIFVPALVTELEQRRDRLAMNLRGEPVPMGLFAKPSGNKQPTANEEGTLAARPVGVSDLMLVRQRLRRYELGEISHIENVARGERKERVHTRLDEREDLVMIETERTVSEERNLQSTERFELQSETQETLSTKAHLEGEVTVSAEYGPSLKVQAQTGFAYDSSREQSQRIASNFSREIVDQSITRHQERTLERRNTRTLRRLEERNAHIIDNTAGANQSAVYRWVDKVYEAQIVNYGRRLLFEAIVPEPSALWRHIQAAEPRGLTTVANPEPPMVRVFSNFGNGLDDLQTAMLPLTPSRLTATNYLDIAGKYGAGSIKPPPSVYRHLTAVLDFPRNDQTDAAVLKSTDLVVPDGYVSDSVHIAYSKHSVDDNWLVNVRIGNDSIDLRDEADYCTTEPVEGKLALGVRLKSIRAAVITFAITCKRTEAAYEAWKYETYKAIMEAYDQKKRAYDDSVAAALARRNAPLLSGRPSEANRSIERKELKRGAINLLTGQSFDRFDSTETDVSPYGYPEIDRDQAAQDGAYIQFFEQAFEWHNMGYVFYPYFWGRKAEWPGTLQQTDDDPLFLQFLQAGAARVLMPVRPGYEEAILYFMATGKIWNGGGPPQLDDPYYVSLATEIREQTGATMETGIGTLSITANSAAVVGTGTSFTQSDVDREVRIAGITYRIASVVDAQNVTLHRGCETASMGAAIYELGPKLVGLPWEVRLATTLVSLQDNPQLPRWDDNGRPI